MKLDLSPEPLPLWYDDYERVRVGDTRVTLDVIVARFNQGMAAEEIAYNFPTVDLPNVYATIAYYLRHQAEADAWLEEEDRKAEEILRQIDALQDTQSLRERLLARKAERERAK